MFMAAQFTIVKSQNQPGCPSADRKKENVSCIYKGLSSSTKKKNNIMLLSGKRTELVITIKWEKQDSKTDTMFSS